MSIPQALTESRARSRQRRKVKAKQSEIRFANEPFALIQDKAPATEFIPPVSREEAGDLFQQMKDFLTSGESNEMGKPSLSL